MKFNTLLFSSLRLAGVLCSDEPLTNNFLNKLLVIGEKMGLCLLMSAINFFILNTKPDLHHLQDVCVICAIKVSPLQNYFQVPYKRIKG